MDINKQFIDTYRNYIYYCIRKVGVKHQETLHDIYTEVMVRVIKTKRNYNPSKGELTTWLNYQVRSVVSNYFAKKARSNDMLDKSKSMELKDDNQHDTVLKVMLGKSYRDDEEARAKAYDAIWLSNLSAKNKEVLSDKVLHHLSAKEIADKRGYAENSVHRRFKRAIGKLKKYYEHKEIKNED